MTVKPVIGRARPSDSPPAAAVRTALASSGDPPPA